jgi:hypothetical protein
MFAMANGQAGQPQTNEKRGDPLGLLYLLCVIHSTCITVFLRTRVGREALGFRGLLALGLLLVCCAGDPLMIWWVVAFLAAVLVQRIITRRATSKGAVIHTLYGGTPLMMKLPFVKKEQSAVVMEMFLCLLAGALLLPVSQFIGAFLMLGFVTLAARFGIEDFVYQRRLDRMNNARIEGSWLGNRMR